MKQLKLFIFFLISVLIFSCNREDIIEKEFTNTDPIDIEYFNRSSISGQVFDEKNYPLSNVEIKYYNEKSVEESIMSDENGYFKIENKPFKEQGQLLTFEKRNHFTQYASIKPKLNRLSIVNIFQQIKEGEKLINPQIENELSYYQNQINCIIPKNSFEDVNGNQFNEKVNFYIKAPYLKEDFVFFNPEFGIPTSDVGKSKDGNETTISPLLSFMVQFENQSGDQLSINKSIKVNVPLYTVQFLEFENLFLWRFDINTGQWVEKSSIEIDFNFAKLDFDIEESGYYILSNKHLPNVELNGYVYYSDGTPAKNTLIELVINDSIGSFIFEGSITDENGAYHFYNQYNEGLILRVYGCDLSTYSDFTPEIQSSSIEDIMLEPNFKEKYNISINTLGNNFEKGFAEIIEYQSFSPSFDIYPLYIDSSDINLNFHSCEPSLVLYDLDNLPLVKSSMPISISNNKTYNPSDYAIDYDVEQYLFAEINNNQENIFDTNISQFLDENDNQVYNIFSSPLSNNFSALRFKKGENLCHFSYLKFSDENEYDLYESTFENPLQLEIILDDNFTISGHFFGDINHNGLNKYIDGYFMAYKF